MHRKNALDSKDLVHGLRRAWVRTKDLIGLPRTGTDRSFYTVEFARAVAAKEIGSNVRITASGKSDGAGAQGLAQISAIAYAHALGLEYIHSPFRSICHVEGSPTEWTRSWEDHFNFGSMFQSIDACGLPLYPLGYFLKDRSLWKSDCVVQQIHYQHWTNANTWSYERVTDMLRANYVRDKGAGLKSKPVVAVHIRRGDVSASRSAKTHFTPNFAIMATVSQAVSMLRQRGIDFEIEIHSEGDVEDFREFAEFSPRFLLSQPAIWSFARLVDADILIMARSAFSYVAALLSGGIKLYDPFREQPLDDWIIRNKNGNFEEADFKSRIDRLIQAEQKLTV